MPPRSSPERAARPGDGAVDPEGLPSLRRISEGGGQEGEHGRGEQGSERALDGPGDDEHREVDREPADGRGRREAHKSDDEGPLASHHVPDTTAEEEQAAEGEGVRGDDPLTVGVREMQGVLSRGQSDVDDGAVENNHELGDPKHTENPPPPAVVGINQGSDPTRVLHRHQRGHRMLRLCSGAMSYAHSPTALPTVPAESFR